MRHRIAHRKLGRVSEHRLALLRNQAQALLRHERINTTIAKAKELRPFVERLISVAKRGIADGADTPRALHARRMVRRDLADRAVATKLFDTVAPRFASRPGGYTRLLRVGRRRGDDAELAQVELIGSEYDPDRGEHAVRRPEEAGVVRRAGGRGTSPGCRAPASRRVEGHRRRAARAGCGPPVGRQSPSPSARERRCS